MPRRPRPRRPLVVATALLAAALVAGPLAGPLPAALAATGDPVTSAGPAAGTFYPVPAASLLGSSAAPALLGAGSTTALTVTGRDGLPPAGVSAVVVNVTADAASAQPALLALRPGQGALDTGGPLTSLTALPGRPRTALVTVPLDAQGGFVVVASGAARVRVDLVGLYAADDTVVAALGPSGGYQPMSPVRVVGAGAGTAVADGDDDGDDGDGTGDGSVGATGDLATAVPQPRASVDAGLSGRLGPGEQRRLALDLGASVAPHVTALLLRVTVVGAPAAGTVTLAPDATAGEPTQPGPGTLAPAASGPASPTVTVEQGGTASNLTVVPAVVDGDGLLRLVLGATVAAPTDVRVDLVGFYDDGDLGPDLRFRSLPVERAVDTRTGVGARGPLSATTTLRPGSDLVGESTFALVGTLTTVGARGAAAAAAQVGVGPVGDEASTGPVGAPGTVPVPAGTQDSTPVQPEVGTDGRLALATTGAAAAPVQAVLDVVGSLEAYPEVSDPSARGWVDAVPAWQVRALSR